MPYELEENAVSLRKRFLQCYIFSLIQNSYIPKEETKVELHLEKQEIKETEPQIQSMISKKSVPLQQPQQAPVKISMLPSLPRHPFLQKTNINLSNIQLPPLPPPSISQNVLIKFGKITKILLDPTVISIECPGPEKNIIINKAGQIQAAPIILTKKEIDDILKEVSDKTRIPIIPGLFKAAVQDLMVTAVVSDYVGTRFIVQKRLPFR